ncbi:unnamed protein product [Linum trigynum]
MDGGGGAEVRESPGAMVEEGFEVPEREVSGGHQPSTRGIGDSVEIPPVKRNRLHVFQCFDLDFAFQASSSLIARRW